MSAQPPPPPPPPPQPGGGAAPPPPVRPPPPYIPASQLRPSQVWFWVIGAIGVLCVGASIALFVSAIVTTVDDLSGPLTELRAPGETSVQLDADTDRTIYRQVRESGTPVAVNAPDPDCTVTSGSGASVEVNDTFEWTLRRSGDRYEALYDFTTTEAGDYRVSCTPGGNAGNAGDPVPLAIGEGFGFWDLITKGGIALGLFLIGIVGAPLAAILVVVLRDNHKKQLQRQALTT